MPRTATTHKPVIAGVSLIPLGDGRYGPPPLAGGATDTAPTARDRLRAIEKNINDLRDERAELSTARDETRQAFLDAGADPDSAEYRKAKAAADRLNDKDEEIGRAQDQQTAILKLLSGDGPGAGGDGSTVEHRQIVKALTEAPGALLSAIFEKRKADVPTLPEHLRYKSAVALSGPVTTENISTSVEADVVIDLLSPQSVALASGIQRLPIDGTKTRVPRFTALPEADWIPELGAFPKNGPGLEMVDVEPNKVGLITEVSIEVFEDLRPLTLAMLQTQLLRAVALKFDQGILFGDGTGASPIGVANTSGIMTVTGVPLVNLAAFSAAIADLIATNANPGALVINPLDLGTLLQLTESRDGVGSNVPLWKASIGSPSGLRLPYLGVPIWPTPAAPRGTALLYDPATIIAVIRRNADIALDPYYSFDNGSIGLRTYMRAWPVVGQVNGAVVIKFGTPATGSASTDVFTATGHGLSDGNAIIFSAVTGGAPLTAGTRYYARDTTANTFKVTATSGGAAIDITSDMTAGTVQRVP
jgi:HK97 family phage major capsid protein